MHKKTLAKMQVVVGLMPNDDLASFHPHKSEGWQAKCKMGCNCLGYGFSKKSALKDLREEHQRFIDRESERIRTLGESPVRARAVEPPIIRRQAGRTPSFTWIPRTQTYSIPPEGIVVQTQSPRPNTTP